MSDDATCPDCNVILISIDDLRADRVGCYGSERNTSPHIDRFAESSVLFSDTLAQYSWTRPSHRSLLNGRYFSRTQEGDATMAGVLHEAGFLTAGFTGGGQVSAELGFAEGFDTYAEGGALYDPEALTWLAEHHQQHFFLFLHTYAVHCPFTPPEPFFSQFTSEYRPPFGLEGRCGYMSEAGNQPEDPLDDFNNLDLRQRDFDFISAVYDGGIAHADDLLGAFFAEIRRLGLMENTIVVVLGDHGESLGEHGHVRHTWIKEEVLRVPLIIHMPGADSGRVIGEPVQLVDVLPTVLSRLGLPIPEGMDGTDLMPVIRGERSFEGTRLRISEGVDDGHLARTVRVDERWKLNVAIESGERTLYDLSENEDEDVLESHPRMAAFLAAQLAAVFSDEDVADPRRIGPVDEALRAQLRALGYTQ